MIGTLAAIVLLAQQSVIVLPAAGIERPNPSLARVDLGVVDELGEKATIERRFRIKNEGGDEIILTAPQLSCGCATALIAGRQLEGFRLESGADAEVTVTLDVTKLKTGLFDKYVWIYAKGKAQPIITLQFDGQLKPVVAFDPPAIRFGRTTAKAARPIAMKVTIDRRLADVYPETELACSSPDVVIKLEGTTNTVDMVERKYTIALAPSARIGMLNAVVSLTPGTSAKLLNDQRFEMLTRYARAVRGTAAVVGEITGSFSATPGTVVFGAISLGRLATRQIALVSAQPIDPTKLKIESACKWLTAKVAGTKPSTRLELNVSFTAEAPAGACDTQILISNPAGEKLVVPVLAYVSR